MNNDMIKKNDPSDSICFILNDSRFSINCNKIKEIFDGKQKSWAFCDEAKKYTIIISLNQRTKKLHFKPLIKDSKEFEIPFNELMDYKSHPCFQIPDTMILCPDCKVMMIPLDDQFKCPKCMKIWNAIHNYVENYDEYPDEHEFETCPVCGNNNIERDFDCFSCSCGWNNWNFEENETLNFEKDETLE